MRDRPDILAAIADRPDDESVWPTLAAWLSARGRDDEAAAVSVFWPAIRDAVEQGTSLHQALRILARNAARLGRQAREIKGRRAAAPDVA